MWEGDGGVKTSIKERHWLRREWIVCSATIAVSLIKSSSSLPGEQEKKSAQHGGHFGAHTIYPRQGSQGSGGK